MRIIFISISLLIILNMDLNAQTKKPSKIFKVIAPVGINFRLKPSLSSDIICSIPFLKPLTILRYTEETDSVKTHKFIDYLGKERTNYLHGVWVEASYNGKKGFVLSPFISSNLGESLFEDSFGLYFPGGACSIYVNPNPKITWYGIYKHQNRFIIHKVDLTHFFGDGEISTFNTFAKSDMQPLFVFGTEVQINTGEIITGKYRIGSFSKKENPNADSLAAKYQRNEEGEIYVSFKTLKQKIQPPFGTIHSIQWKGDIDGDGIDDYIFHTGYGGANILYLSSPAQEGDILKAVASFSTGVCC